MGVVEIKSGEDLEKAKMKGLVLIDFSVPWSAPCRLQEPIIQQLAGQFEGKAFIASVNIDKNLEMAFNLGIKSIPTLIIFKNGNEIQRFVGLQSQAGLSKTLMTFLK